MTSALAAALALYLAGSARGATVVLPPSDAWVTIPSQELTARYDVVWAVSDVHGHLQELSQLLRAAGLAAPGAGGQLTWAPRLDRQLLIVVGDSIDGGPDSVGVVLTLRALQAQAAAAGSRVILLLGNHEAGFLYKPRSATVELVSSAARAGIQLRRKHAGEQLAEGEFGDALREEPLLAVVGLWLFAHSGWIDAADDDGALRDYFAQLASAWSRGGRERYAPLHDALSILESHNWWRARRRRSLLKAHLSRLGLQVLAFGHDPDALGAMGTLGVDEGGSLVKLDTGLKTGASRGMLLRCEVVNGPGLAIRSGGRSTCRAMAPDGALHDLPVR